MLEGLLKKQIRENPNITGMLATYNGRPAFFYQKAPEDTDCKWQKPCFPRMDYNIDMRDDPERKVSGILIFNIWCSEESNVMPEDIGPKIIELVSGTFYTNKDKTTLCAIWSRTEAFEYQQSSGSNQQDKGAPKVFGATLVFDLTAFPVQLTTDPDPIQAINYWTKEYFKEAVVITHDTMPDIWKPTSEFPAIYWRFLGAEATNRSSYAVSWFDCQIVGHIITDSVEERNRWIKAMSEELTVAGEIILADNSPMFIKKLILRNNADRLRDGQLTILGAYGVLAIPRKDTIGHKLMQANFNYKFGGVNNG